MKVYTKTGDKKTTKLIGNKDIVKSNLRVECYGTCDEALAQIGLVYSSTDDNLVKEHLIIIMKLFFYINQDLANPDKLLELAIKKDDSLVIENLIDLIDSKNDPLEKFVLPVGTKEFSYANIARTTIRKAERKIVELSTIEEINEDILPLINRLSDYFFVLARYFNKKANFKEIEMIF